MKKCHTESNVEQKQEKRAFYIFFLRQRFFYSAYTTMTTTTVKERTKVTSLFFYKINSREMAYTG